MPRKNPAPNNVKKIIDSKIGEGHFKPSAKLLEKLGVSESRYRNLVLQKVAFTIEDLPRFAEWLGVNSSDIVETSGKLFEIKKEEVAA